MQFYSFIFLIFLIIGLYTYYLSNKNYLKKFIFLTLNYTFYCYFDIRFAFLLFGITIINYFAGNFISEGKNEKSKNLVFYFSILFNLLALGFFKYYNFFIESISALLNTFGFSSNIPTLTILAPLGISYYIFQTLTYIFDLQYNSLEKKVPLIDYMIFSTFFPTIVAGPIERASTLLPQISSLKTFRKEFIQKGFALITIGMLRKLIIADPLGLVVGQIFSEPQYYKSIEILIAIILYPIQLYNDFAGYSSIARGVAKLFGFDIISNFKQPFFSKDIVEFWRRWHISFSFWLRDYLFTPLRLKYRDKGNLGIVCSIMLTFFICGLWHGPTWGNVLWGLIHGFYLSTSVLTSNFRKKITKIFDVQEIYLNILRSSFLFLMIVFSFLVARADNLNQVFFMLNSVLHWSHSELTLRFISILITGLSASFLVDYFENKYKSQAFLMYLKPSFKYSLYLTLWVFFILLFMTQNKLPFIYEKF